jgi:hypothetical protein
MKTKAKIQRGNQKVKAEIVKDCNNQNKKIAKLN